MVRPGDDEQAPTERFSSEEMAFLRYVRFGELPPRVLPDELVQTVETEQPSLPVERRFDPDPYWG